MVQPGVYRIKNVASGTYLDASLKNPGVVHGWEGRPDNKNQKWEVERRGNHFVIQNVGTQDYLKVWKDEDSIDVKAKDSPSNWNITEKDGAYLITTDENRAIDLDKGRDDNGTAVNIWRASGAQWQLWQLEGAGGGGGGQQGGYQSQSGVLPGRSNQAPPQTQGNYQGAVQPGTYYIRNVHTGTALDLAGGSNQDGTRVIGYSAGNGSNQQWTLTSGFQGYTIKNGASGTYASYGRQESPVDGVLLTGNNHQVEWEIKQADQGYQIVLAGTNLALDLASGDASDGAKVCLWGNNGQNNQKWRIDRV